MSFQLLFLFIISRSPILCPRQVAEMCNTPSGIWTRVLGSKGRYPFGKDWPD